MNEPKDGRLRAAPFAPFEWMLSARYLRARRREGFISVIAGFSFLGIMLGVATLIVVMAVLNGFRKELLDKILGLNGHLVVQPLETPLTDWEGVADRVAKVNGIRLAAPIVEGQALASSPFNASGVLVRGVRGTDLANLGSIARNIKQGTLDGFDLPADASDPIEEFRFFADRMGHVGADRSNSLGGYSILTREARRRQGR